MTTDNEEPTGPAIFQLAVCSVCDALFLMSGRRETSPCHGSDPILVVATLEVEPDGDVVGSWGAGAPIGEPGITDQPEVPAAPPEPAPAGEDAEEPREEVSKDFSFVTRLGAAFLDGGAVRPEELTSLFEQVGAGPEEASTAVGRLQAVRDLIRQLSRREEPASKPGAPSAMAPETAPPALPSGDAVPPPPPSPVEEAPPPANPPAETPSSQ